MVFLARPDDGLIDADAALELASSLGDPEGQSYALWHRSEALSAIGRLDEAEQAARDALDIASRLGHRGWTATALRALGIALTCRGELSGAEEAFSESLTTAEHMPLFASWAAARLALVLVTMGRLVEAAPFVDRATVEGPPLGHYEARLARVELAAARHEEKAASLAAEALSAAEAGGHLASVPRLVELASP
jgi:tetratricopeptide (TPR) repeat protein